MALDLAKPKKIIQVTRKASRKSDIDNFFFNQSHPSSQKIYAWKPKAYSNKTFGLKNKKVLALSDSYYQQ